MLNNRHKATGEVFAEAVAAMTTLNRDASRAALDAGARAPPTSPASGCSVTCSSCCRASGVTAVIDAAAVPYLDGARVGSPPGYIPGGSRRNLDWVRPHLDATVDEDELLLLADAQTSGGLLVAGEVPGYPVIGRLLRRAGPEARIRVR